MLTRKQSNWMCTGRLLTGAWCCRWGDGSVWEGRGCCPGDGAVGGGGAVRNRKWHISTSPPTVDRQTGVTTVPSCGR